MDRRKFLKGLFATGAVIGASPILLEEVSRVYSFPSKVTVHATIGEYADYFSHSDLSLQTSLVTYYNKKFLSNLKAQIPLYAMAQRRKIVPSGVPGQFLYVPLTGVDATTNVGPATA